MQRLIAVDMLLLAEPDVASERINGSFRKLVS